MEKYFFGCIALYFLFDLIIVIYKRMTYQPVDSICVDLAEAWIHTDMSTSYGKKGIFEYTFSDCTFREAEKGFPSGKKLKVGQRKTIYVCKKNHHKFITKDNIKRTYYINLLGVVTMLLAIFVF